LSDVEVSAFLLKQGDMDLVQSPDQEARALFERP